MRLVQSALFGVLLTIPLAAQTAESDAAIRRVLDGQQAAWNRGDVRAFIETYEDAPDTAFVGANGVTKGRAEILARYLKRYDKPEKMGKLTFADLDVLQLCPDHASVIGKWHLARDATFGGNARGSFTLLLRRTAAGWRIVMDHTESDATLATAARRERGIVKWFNASKGYGFIANTSGEDVFVHFSAINSSGYRILVDGDSVEYTPKRGPKGVQAEDIKVLPKGSNRPRSF